MTGTVLLFCAMTLLASYGLYCLCHIALRYFFPYRHKMTLYASALVGLAFVFVFSGLTARSFSRFSERSGNMLSKQERGADAYEEDDTLIEAYSQGYADAMRSYYGQLSLQMSEPDEFGQDEGSTEYAETREIIPMASSELQDVDPDTTVYYTQSGSVLHFDAECPYLKNASSVLSCACADAPDRAYCSRCGPGRHERDGSLTAGPL